MHTSHTHRKQCPRKEKGEERLIIIRRDKLIKIPLVGFYNMQVGYRSTVFDIDNSRINHIHGRDETTK